MRRNYRRKHGRKIACEDLVLADLNGDGKLDIVGAGRATHNLKIYLHQPAPPPVAKLNLPKGGSVTWNLTPAIGYSSPGLAGQANQNKYPSDRTVERSSTGTARPR